MSSKLSVFFIPNLQQPQRPRNMKTTDETCTEAVEMKELW